MPEFLNGDAQGLGELTVDRWRGYIDARLADISRRIDVLNAAERVCSDKIANRIDLVEERVEHIERLVENWKGRIYIGAILVGMVGALAARVAVFFMEHIAHKVP